MSELKGLLLKECETECAYIKPFLDQLKQKLAERDGTIAQHERTITYLHDLLADRPVTTDALMRGLAAMGRAVEGDADPTPAAGACGTPNVAGNHCQMPAGHDEPCWPEKLTPAAEPKRLTVGEAREAALDSLRETEERIADERSAGDE